GRCARSVTLVVRRPVRLPRHKLPAQPAGILDPAELERFEAEQTSIILAQLARQRLPGRYDVAHLKSFHRRIFGDIYEWAGELRTVVIAKEASLFALPEHIEDYLTKVLAQLAAEDLLRGL